MHKLEAQHQACLDEGIQMLRCTEVYYLQMDSMLNVVYKQLCSKLYPATKERLKKEQLQWLKKRDAYFKNVKLGPEEQELAGGEDEIMILLDRKAEYINDRIMVLIEQLDK